MSLWRVEIAKITQRYVEAATAGEACQIVAIALVADMALTATPASDVLEEQYGRLKTKAHRRMMLAELDGLMSRRTVRARKARRRELERLIESDERDAAWVAAQLAQAPPVSAEQLEKLALLLSYTRRWDALDARPE